MTTKPAFDLTLYLVAGSDVTGGRPLDEVVRTARQRRTNPTADYLLGTPLLGDYLEEGLTQLGLTLEDLEPVQG